MKTLAAVVIFLSVGFGAWAQTSVSGGIYSNAIWTKVNSPYIVTDIVVVFPGVTLTIEPGVVVKFENDKRLEIRQAELIALGTPTDSITFTSNSGSPFPGIWGEVYLNTDTSSRFSYCNFSYAISGIKPNNAKNLTFRNSVFTNNISGWGYSGSSDAYQILFDSCIFINNLGGGMNGFDNSKVYNCKISNNGIGVNNNLPYRNEFLNCEISYDSIGLKSLRWSSMKNCLIKSNLYGIKEGGLNSIIENCTIDSNVVCGVRMGGMDTVRNCRITNNGIGLDEVGHTVTGNIIENNDTGIIVTSHSSNIYCNVICNSNYNLYYAVPFGGNATFPNNYWCTTDSALIASKIYDGYDNINLSLVNFMPADTTQCSTATGITASGIEESFSVYPNPTQDKWQLNVGDNLLGGIAEVFDANGRVVFNSKLQTRNSKLELDVARGVYLLRISSAKGSVVRKLIRL